MTANPTPSPKSFSVTSAASAVKGLSFVRAESPGQGTQARALFLEYAQSLGFSLCFQNFDQELAGLPGGYAPPEGPPLLAECESHVTGGGALARHRDPN